jgi:hypothetical protein
MAKKRSILSRTFAAVAPNGCVSSRLASAFVTSVRTIFGWRDTQGFGWLWGSWYHFTYRFSRIEVKHTDERRICDIWS